MPRFRTWEGRDRWPEGTVTCMGERGLMWIGGLVVFWIGLQTKTEIQLQNQTMEVRLFAERDATAGLVNSKDTGRL